MADAGDGPGDRSNDLRLGLKSLFLRFRTFNSRRLTFEMSSFLRSLRFRVSDEAVLFPDFLVLDFWGFANDSTFLVPFFASVCLRESFPLIIRLGFIYKTALKSRRRRV